MITLCEVGQSELEVNGSSKDLCLKALQPEAKKKRPHQPREPAADCAPLLLQLLSLYLEHSAPHPHPSTHGAGSLPRSCRRSGLALCGNSSGVLSPFAAESGLLSTGCSLAYI